MNKEELLKKIKAKAKVDAKNRHDPRYLETMGFLVAKGFLKTNRKIPLVPNKKLEIDHAVWAGLNVEPRILEVLPAAVLRLARHFDLDPLKHRELAEVVDQLRRRVDTGADFCGMPYEKVKVWVDLPLRDKRTKTMTEKKVVKTFRLDPAAVMKLRKIAKEKNCNETEILENLIFDIE
jgi:hypothetical protein